MNFVTKKFIFATCIGLSFSLAFVGCTGRRAELETERGTSPTDKTDTSTETNFNFDTSSDAGNLFDTDTSSDTTNTDLNTTATTIDDTSSMCLASDAGLTGGYATDDSAASGGYELNNPTQPACFNTASSRNAEFFYQLTISKLEAMGECYDMVARAGNVQTMQYPSTVNFAAVPFEQKFQMGRMGLVRCFRKILKREMAMLEWSQPQQENYQNTDATLFFLLQMMANGQGNNDLSFVIPIDQ